uniref:Uncharacterized protein n=1 Tax=Grammatophora oceanica TaxID=210454 RepID=A0A7S1Y0C2_9STRA|mmetsp:Transcript_14405/g.21133  ORF Transcript_14405/g.21133 Transcript_14405/m.21133 type:complete len:112 (+) Transcript_14405:20-355(+)
MASLLFSCCARPTCTRNKQLKAMVLTDKPTLYLSDPCFLNDSFRVSRSDDGSINDLPLASPSFRFLQHLIFIALGSVSSVQCPSALLMVFLLLSDLFRELLATALGVSRFR